MSAKARSSTPPLSKKGQDGDPKGQTSESVQKNGKDKKDEPKSPTDWAMVGHVVNVVILGIATAYAIAVVGHGAGWWVLNAFGQNWARDGFCISFKGTLVHTHLLCLYGDTIFTALMLWATHGTKRSELIAVRDSAISVFFHGLAHGFIWANEKWGVSPSPDAPFLSSSTQPLLLVPAVVGVFGFWVSFLCMNTKIPWQAGLAQSIVHTVVIGFYVPTLLLFCYVNTVLFFNLTGSQMYYGLEGHFDIFYALSTFMITIPVMAATWAEPLFCDAGLVNYGGHIIFDYTIPASSLAYFAVALKLPPRKVKKED